MSFLTRIALFLVVNLLVVLTLSIALNLLGIQPYLTAYGIDVRTLAIFCLIWGMSGSLISLFLSKSLAKRSMAMTIIDPLSRIPQEKRLLDIINKLSRQAKLSKSPEIGIYNSQEVNAFATGATKRSALIAVSSGLLARMNDGEVEGVLGHEMAHVANGDMVTMTLLQGIVNAFVMFLARMIAVVVSKASSTKEEHVSLGMGFSLVVNFLETVFMFFGMIVIAWYSRHREFRADEGGAALSGREKMVSALKKLQELIQIQDPRDRTTEASFQIFKISTPRGLLRLFATHPPLEERIKHLLEIPVR